jgi:hypothetical protein
VIEDEHEEGKKKRKRGTREPKERNGGKAKNKKKNVVKTQNKLIGELNKGIYHRDTEDLSPRSHHHDDNH